MTDETRRHWMALLSQTRDAFNRCASLVTSSETSLSLVSVHNLCYDTLRREFPSLPSQGVIRVQKSVLAAFRSIRSNKHRDAETPRKKSLSLQLDKRLYSNLSANGISLSNGTPQKRERCTFVLYPKAIEMFSTCAFKDPTIFARNGRLFLSVPFEVATPPVSGEMSIGVDLGMKRLFVTSEGLYYKDSDYLKRRRRLRYLKRCLQGRKTRSSKRHLRKVSRRERNMSRDMLNRAADTLLRSTDADILVLEDLSRIKRDTSRTGGGHKRKRHNCALSQVPLYEFRRILTHKAPLLGKRVETVSPTWTSQTDSRTGKRDGERHGCRYCCADGVVLDADWNAAVNIARRANHPTSTVLPIDGGMSALVGRARSTARSSRT